MKRDSQAYHYLTGASRARLRKCCSSLTVVFLALFVLHLLSSSTIAQTTTSTIDGVVKDAKGGVVAGAQVTIKSDAFGVERSTTTDTEGFYRITALPAGTYNLSVSRSGFAAGNVSNVELTINRTLTLDVQLEVGALQAGQVNVNADVQLIDPTASSTGTTVTPRQIQDYPVNGRNYLDLLQLVPGVAINRQSVGDNANPVLGERSGNNNFLIDGQPNKDTVNGGAAAPFNQETIAEFQVLTAGYKAEFGQASGATVNVITKSGGNGFHGVGSLFHRNNGFDGKNSLDPTKTKAPFLHRFDYSLALGGPVIKDKVFFFGSSERITENRQLDFLFPSTNNAVVDGLLHAQEDPFNNLTRTFETRNFFKLDEQLGRHHLTEELNYTNQVVREFSPLSASGSLPSTRNDSGARHLLLGFADTMLLGEKGSPWVVTLRGAYRGEPSDTRPTHPSAGAGTLFVPYSSSCTLATCLIFGDLPRPSFGNAVTASNLKQKYTSLSANADKLFGNHEVKFGWNFLRTTVDGLESQTLQEQLFASVTEFATLGNPNSGISLLLSVGGLTPAANEIHLRNNYHGLFVQDDWKLRHNLTLNLGLRWDYDSEFVTKRNFSPRLGFAWAVNPKTVVRGHFGVFYDQFRLGLARDVPAFGGADQRLAQLLIFPRGFYGSPSFVSSIALLSGLPGGCFSNALVGNLTDAQIAASVPVPTCPFGGPLIGADRLNRVVAAGHAPIPANAVITVSNVQALTGLTPDQYAAQASAAIGQPAGYFTFGPFGLLNNAVLPPRLNPTTIDGTFRTPHTLSFSVGAQREITKDMVIEVDYFHRDIRDLLGVRKTNLAFQSRVVGRTFLPPFTAGEIETFGPFYKGVYDGLIFNFNKRFSRRFQLGANYAFAHATDNSLGINTNPSDNFVGIVPVVSSTEAGVVLTNANGPYTRANGRFVAQAGTFLNGPDADKGPSSLAVNHIFQINGLMQFPWQIQVSGIFRMQSGFHFNRQCATACDADGDGNSNTIDLGPGAGRNFFTAPAFANLDMRLAKRFKIGERVKAQVLFEFFNLLNHQNPAAVGQSATVPTQPFGKAIQVLPGREGQIGFRIEF